MPGPERVSATFRSEKEGRPDLSTPPQYAGAVKPFAKSDDRSAPLSTLILLQRCPEVAPEAVHFRFLG